MMLYLALLKARTRLLALVLCLPLIAGLVVAPASVGAQTPAQPAPPAPAPTVAPAPPAPPADVLSYVGDILPQRQRDLFVMRLDGSDKKQLTQGFNVWFASWSPDGKKLAVTTEGAQIYTLNADGSNLQLLTDGAYSPPFWSPDGHFIAFVGGEKFGMPLAKGNLRIIPSAGGAPWVVSGGEDIPSLPPGAAAVAWSPDGTRIAAGWPGRILHIAGGPGAPVGIEPLPGSNQNLFVIAGGWAPDGKHLAVTDGITYGILDLSNGNLVSVAQSFKQPAIARAGVSWAPGIGKVAFAVNSAAQDGQRLFLADLDGQNAKVILSAPHVAVYHGEVSDYGPPFFSSDFKTMLLRVSRTTKQPNGTLLYTHESWLVHTDGSGGQKLVDGFNANWQPKTKLKLPDSGFWFQWRVPDLPVSNGQAARPYLWGPTAIFSGTEPYAEAPGGKELVVYFDKGRMDLPDLNPPQPTKFVVVPGALAKELVTGQIATGATQTEARPPANVPVAGDLGDINAPTYETFNKLGAGTDAGKAQDSTGNPVDATLAPDGTVGKSADLGTLAKFAAFVPETGHNIPDVFLNYFKAQPWDWIYIAGYPISEPYWAKVQVAGQPHDVLMQIFERRTVTYDPSAPDGFKVQFGNVGRHYYDWRYGQ
jgi:Tol biopolymer transport system component